MLLTAGVLLRPELGWDGTSGGLVALGLLTLTGLADALTTRVTLHDEQLETVHNFRRKRQPRSGLVKVVAERGCPIAIQCEDGSWIHLPETVQGPSAQMLRAWIGRREGKDPRG